MHYFGCTIPRQMSGFKIYEVNVNFEPGDPTRFFPCLELQEKEKIDYWVFFRGEFCPQQVLEQLNGKKINISTEPIGREDVQRMYLGQNKPFYLEHFKQYDYFTHYDCTEIPDLKANGFEVDTDFMLPVDIDTYRPEALKKIYDVVFLGRSTTRRAMLTGMIKKDFNMLHVDNGMFGEEAVRVYNQSKIGLNINVGAFKQNQHRVFNMMACGLPIVSDVMSHTNWMKEEDKLYFDFLKEPDGRMVYSKILELLEGTAYPSLETRGKIMRRIAVNQFNASKNWAHLIEKVDCKGMRK